MMINYFVKWRPVIKRPIIFLKRMMPICYMKGISDASFFQQRAKLFNRDFKQQFFFSPDWLAASMSP